MKRHQTEDNLEWREIAYNVEQARFMNVEPKEILISIELDYLQREIETTRNSFLQSFEKPMLKEAYKNYLLYMNLPFQTMEFQLKLSENFFKKMIFCLNEEK